MSASDNPPPHPPQRATGRDPVEGEFFNGGAPGSFDPEDPLFMRTDHLALLACLTRINSESYEPLGPADLDALHRRGSL